MWRLEQGGTDTVVRMVVGLFGVEAPETVKTFKQVKTCCAQPEPRN
jgi:hypothetical protein